jgi:transcriptional regulator with XRE-family HTH domain
LASLRQIFGANLRQQRRVRGWTQAQLAERSGLSIDMIGRLERGSASASFDTIEVLAQALEISAAILFGGTIAGGRPSGRRGVLLHRITSGLARANDKDLARIDRIVVALLQKER